jgi:hypothetical protein
MTAGTSGSACRHRSLLVAFSHLQFSRFRGPPPLLNCAKHCQPHQGRCRASGQVSHVRLSRVVKISIVDHRGTPFNRQTGLAPIGSAATALRCPRASKSSLRRNSIIGLEAQAAPHDQRARHGLGKPGTFKFLGFSVLQMTQRKEGNTRQ